MHREPKKFFHQKDIADYGLLMHLISRDPKLFEQFYSFKREQEARDRQDRRHLAFCFSVENVASGNTTLDLILGREQTCELHKAISCLTATQQRRVILRFWHDLTYQRIAEIEGTSRTAVTKSIRQSLWKIKKEIIS